MDLNLEELERSKGFETANYAVTHYHLNHDRLILVFISAGRMGPGEPIEEFKKSLQSLGVSVVFIRDKQTHWFNHAETRNVFQRIAKIVAAYRNVGALGESMGGSGALLGSELIPGISRVLSLSPQYSISKPFINFDSRYEPISRTIKHHFFAGFSGTKMRDGCVLIYGNIDWKDCFHSSGFMAEGFSTVFIENAPHSVAGYLKTERSGNRLIQLLNLLCDFSKPFTVDAVKSALSELVAEQWIKTGYTFADEFGRNRQVLRELNDKYAATTGREIGPNRCIGKVATQSSVGQWSRSQDIIEEASGALSGEVNGFYSFHTDFEKEPWWMVDLDEAFILKEVRIFNYIAEAVIAGRSSKFVLEISLDGETWHLMHKRTDETPFGGSDGNPFLWRPTQNIAARYVRIRLTTENWLHLDQVEVYGDPIPVLDAGVPPVSSTEGRSS